jgi:4-aminobutyrate aminotransferase/(S)-3-amino-2-methylpropionate transaminase
VHPPRAKVELLESLQSVTPSGLDFAHLGLNGADAVETALKCAELVTGRAGVIAFEGGYHGLATGALGVSARRDFRDPFAGRGLGPTTFVEFPSDDSAADRVLGELRRKLSSMGSGLPPTGALIVEPIQGRGGVVVPPDGFLTSLRAVCDEHDLLLIADEIFTGLGRTGRWFACEHDDIVPDLLCVGKALGGGMPLSACVGGATSLGKWPVASGEALHTATFLGHPVSCAAGIAALSELAERGLVERAARLGERAATRLSAAGLPVRGRGLMLGIPLRSGELASEVMFGALDRGVLLLPSGPGGTVLSITPPLTIGETELDDAVDIIIELATP